MVNIKDNKSNVLNCEAKKSWYSSNWSKFSYKILSKNVKHFILNFRIMC